MMLYWKFKIFLKENAHEQTTVKFWEIKEGEDGNKKKEGITQKKGGVSYNNTKGSLRKTFQLIE